MSSSVPLVGTVPTPLPPGPRTFRGMRKRWWAFRLVDLLARHWPVFGQRKGMLVVRIDGIGDMLMFRPALDHYPEAFGVAKEDITVLGCKSWGSLAEPLFAGYRVKAIDEARFQKKMFYRLKIGLWVRRQNFAIASCDSFFRKALVADSLVWTTGAPRVFLTRPWISRKTRAEHAYYLGSHRYIDTGDYPTHEVLRHFTFLSAVAGRPFPPETPVIPWPRGRSVVPPGAPYVVVHFGCNEPGRRWPFANFVRLVERLTELGHRVVLTGAAREADVLADHPAVLQREGVVNLVCKTTLPQTFDVIADARAVVANETGPGHVAITLGVPTVMVMGGGHFGNFVPYPAEVCPPHARFAYQPMDCYHCFYNCTRRRAGQTSFPCFVDVPFDRVWAALMEILDQRETPLPPLEGAGAFVKE